MLRANVAGSLAGIVMRDSADHLLGLVKRAPLLFVLLLAIACAHNTAPNLRADEPYPLVCYPEPLSSETGKRAEDIIYRLLKKHHVHLSVSASTGRGKNVYVWRSDEPRARKLVATAIKENHLDAQLVFP